MVFGSLLLMGAQTLWGGYTIVSKPMLARGAAAAAGADRREPLLDPVHLGREPPARAWGELPTVADWSAATWLGVAYMIVFASGLSQVMYIYGCAT
jgi:drug/metabolite transporter (DMT)-like permease